MIAEEFGMMFLAVALLAVAIFFLFLPCLVASSRNAESQGWILFFTILGWFTGVFWLIALLWAIFGSQKRTVYA